MVSSVKAIEVLSKVVGSWHMSVVDATGLSGGLLSAWNPQKAIFDVYKSVASITLRGRYLNGVQVINILNCYGPYHDRIPFWNHIHAGGILKQTGLIIGGDLNFTLSGSETWGSM